MTQKLAILEEVTAPETEAHIFCGRQVSRHCHLAGKKGP